MEIKVRIDLSRYSDYEIAMFFAQGLISRDELEQWRQEKWYGQPVRPAHVEL